MNDVVIDNRPANRRSDALARLKITVRAALPNSPLAERDILLAAMDYAYESSKDAIDDIQARRNALAGEKG